MTELVSVTDREAYIQELYRKVVEDKSSASFIELGRIASGRIDLPLARELFEKLEQPNLPNNNA